MKKLLAIALIAASFTACNEGEKSETSTTSSDTQSVVTQTAPDTAQVVTTMDTTIKMTTDTINKTNH